MGIRSRFFERPDALLPGFFIHTMAGPRRLISFVDGADGRPAGRWVVPGKEARPCHKREAPAMQVEKNIAPAAAHDERKGDPI